MDRDTAISMAQQAIKANNRRLVEAVLEIQAGRGTATASRLAAHELPEIAVTCATGWECYAIVEELTKTRKFRVRALYRTPGTQAAARLEALLRARRGRGAGPADAASGRGHELAGGADEGVRGLTAWCCTTRPTPARPARSPTTAMTRWAGGRW
jgi:hypothetical protein